MNNQNKSGGVPKCFARLPILARALTRSTLLLLLLITSCEKIDLTPGDATVPDDSSSSLTDTLPTEIIEVEAIPTPCTLWQGHIVALVEPITIASGSPATVPESVGEPVESTPSDSPATVPKASALVPAEALITLLSLYEWSNLPSALNEVNPTLASTLASSYQEYDLYNWRIPTADQAKALKAAYPAPVPEGPSSATVPEGSLFATIPEGSLFATIPEGPLFATVPEGSLFATVPEGPLFATVPEESSSGINALILQAEGLPIDPDARYLCEEGTKSFSFAPGTTISTAGAKATTYRLRLVKKFHLRVQR